MYFALYPFQQRLGQAELAMFTSNDVSALGYLLNLFSFWTLLPSYPSSRWHLRGPYTSSQFFSERSKQLSHVCRQSLVYRILLFWICMCHFFSSHHQFKQQFRTDLNSWVLMFCFGFSHYKTHFIGNKKLVSWQILDLRLFCFFLVTWWENCGDCLISLIVSDDDSFVPAHLPDSGLYLQSLLAKGFKALLFIIPKFECLCSVHIRVTWDFKWHVTTLASVENYMNRATFLRNHTFLGVSFRILWPSWVCLEFCLE